MFNRLPVAGSPRLEHVDMDKRSRGLAVRNYTSNEVVSFGKCNVEKEDAFDICSPPLWKTSNSHQKFTNYSQLSADAKAQAVARGQEELMEMIKNMPESSYELSLKDLVEHNHQQRTETQKPCHRLEEERMNRDNKKTDNPFSHFSKEVFGKTKTDVIMRRSGSLNNGGFLLKMVLPFDFGLKGKKQVILSESKHADSKVSPRSSSVRSWDGLLLFGENEGIGKTSRSDMKRSVSCWSSNRTNSKNSRKQASGVGCWSIFSFKQNNFVNE